jgi:hypothetical protein
MIDKSNNKNEFEQRLNDEVSDSSISYVLKVVI